MRGNSRPRLLFILQVHISEVYVMATTTAGKADSDPLSGDYQAIRKDLNKLQAEFGALLDHLRPIPGHGVDELTRQARRQLDERPIAALAAAFLAGFVLHLLLGRR
jgi:hypothetical protein